jgi:transposase
MKCPARGVAGMKLGCRGAEAMSRRHELTDEQWNAIKDLLPGKEGDPGVTAKDNRLFVNAIFYVAKTGIPWRDLPERFGHWHRVFQRFNRWCKKGVFTRVFEALRDPDLEVLMLDSTVIRAHQHSAGQKNSTPEKEQLGRSRGGVSTKIHVAVDGLGQPTKIFLSPGQDHDVTKGPELIQGSQAEKMIADKAYDSDRLIAQIEAQGATPVIPPRQNRTEPRDYDREEYKKRNVVERFINVLKQCRRVATRYDKTARNFLGFVLFASTLIGLS